MKARHQGDKKTFAQLDKHGQARSLSGQIRSLEMGVARHIKDADSKDQKVVSNKCKAQVGRLLARLNAHHP